MSTYNGKPISHELAEGVHQAMKNVVEGNFTEITIKPEVFERACYYMQNLTTTQLDNLVTTKNCNSIMEYVERELNIVPSVWKGAPMESVMYAASVISNSVEHPPSDSDEEM
mgnify:CR=1 FL=1|tara:strand:- start:1861 stop:2196 length:336 start_codon:yes stop_codon:yes gene_type:complete